MVQLGTAMTIGVLRGRIAGPSCRKATIHPARIFEKGIKIYVNLSPFGNIDFEAIKRPFGNIHL